MHWTQLGAPIGGLGEGGWGEAGSGEVCWGEVGPGAAGPGGVGPRGVGPGGVGPGGVGLGGYLSGGLRWAGGQAGVGRGGVGRGGVGRGGWRFAAGRGGRCGRRNEAGRRREVVRCGVTSWAVGGWVRFGWARLRAAVLLGLIAALIAPAEPAAGRVGRPGQYAWPLAPPHPVVRAFSAPATPYGPGHRGVDLGGTVGEAVFAAGGGTVVFAGPVGGRPVVSLAHDSGLRTTYEPVEPVVHAGSTIRRGDLIGTLLAGHDGCPAVACLHWGARRGLDYVNPIRLVTSSRVRLLPLTPVAKPLLPLTPVAKPLLPLTSVAKPHWSTGTKPDFGFASIGTGLPGDDRDAAAGFAPVHRFAVLGEHPPLRAGRQPGARSPPNPAQRGLRQGDDGRFRRSGDRDWSWPEVLNFRPRTTADDVEVRRGG